MSASTRNMKDGGQEERVSLSEWWESLSDPQKLALVIVLCVFGTFAAILMIFEPIILSFRLEKLWPLLLYSIPIGIGVGIGIWSDF